MSVTKKMSVTEKYVYRVLSYTIKSKMQTLEKLEEGEATGCRLCKHCGCVLITEGGPHAADLEQEINHVWPKIVPSRRRCPLVGKLDKRRFYCTGDDCLHLK